jgi:hypothetical protein
VRRKLADQALVLDRPEDPEVLELGRVVIEVARPRRRIWSAADCFGSSTRRIRSTKRSAFCASTST